MSKKRAHGIICKVQAARDAARADINKLSVGGKNASGQASEGYVGGYYDALCDVLLALYGVQPNRRGWWGEKK